MNKAFIIGRLTKTPELKYSQSGYAVTSFTVAVDRRFKEADGHRATDFINCVAWRQTAEFVSRYFDKGQLIAVIGTIQTRQYTDRDGNKRTATEIIAEEVNFCGGKSDGTANAGQASATQPQATSETPGAFEEYDESDGELPF